MSALKVEPGSAASLPDRKQVLSPKKLKKVGDFFVKHSRRVKGNDGEVSDDLIFTDSKGRKASASVIHAKSAKAARLGLFSHLVMNSMPMPLVLKTLAIQENDLGELCIVGKTLDKATNKYMVDRSQFHFVRGNVAVSLYRINKCGNKSVDKSVDILKLAKAIDQILAKSPTSSK